MSRGDEFELHCGVVTFLKTAAPACVTLHIPNGEWRSEAAGRRLKRMGTTAGAFDLIVLAPNVSNASATTSGPRKEILSRLPR